MAGCEHNSSLTENCVTCISIRKDVNAFWDDHCAHREPYYRENPRWLDLMQATDEHEELASHQVFFEYCYEDHGCQNDNPIPNLINRDMAEAMLARIVELERRCTQLENDRTSD